MSETTKRRAFVLRPHEVRRLKECGSVMVVREAVWPLAGPNSGLGVRGVVPSLLLNKGDLWDVRYDQDNPIAVRCPFGRAGDEFVVKEDIRIISFGASVAEIVYVADYAKAIISDDGMPNRCGVVPAARAPRHSSRFTVVVDGVQCKPIQSVTEDEAIATGCDFQIRGVVSTNIDAWKRNAFHWFATMRRAER